MLKSMVQRETASGAPRPFRRRGRRQRGK
jgi:hypothetical protein